jgi:hypothetical protein
MKAPTPFTEAFLDCDLESVKQLLAGVDSNLHYKPNGRTALHNVAEEMVVDSTHGPGAALQTQESNSLASEVWCQWLALGQTDKLCRIFC